MDWLQKETKEYSAQSSRKLNMEDGESLDEEPALKSIEEYAAAAAYSSNNADR